jgi:hypothetical protein
MRRVVVSKVNSVYVSRRAWLVAAASVCAGALLHDAGEAAQAAGLPRLDPNSPTAHSLGYVADAAGINPKSEPTFKVGSRCANCLQLQGKEGDSWRPCRLFPGQLVSATGWCRVWIPKQHA